MVKNHWDNVYHTKAEQTVSWFQERANLSLELIRQAAPDKSMAIVDVGGGVSRLVDDLLSLGLYTA